MSTILAGLLKDNDSAITTIFNDEGIKISGMFSEVFGNFSQYMETGNINFLKNELVRTKIAVKANPISSTIPTENKKGRDKVFTDITENIELQNVKIKSERISTVSTDSVESGVSSVDGNDKQQLGTNVNEEDMPAPKRLPPRKRKIKNEPIEAPKRSTRTRKQLNKEEPSDKQNLSYGKPSDVAIQDTTIPIIDISSEPDEKETNKENTRSTRTKTRQKLQAAAAVGNLQIKIEPLETKPIRSTRTKTRKQEYASVGDNKNTENEEKTNSPLRSNLDKGDGSNNIEPDPDKSAQADLNKTGHTEYEDALSSPGQHNVNTTYVKEKDVNYRENKHIENNMPSSNQNENLNASKTEKVSKNTNKADTISVVSTKIPVKAQNGTPKPLSKKNKEIFSPYEKSSTKKKVEAFEKLKNNGRDSPSFKSKTKGETDKNLKRDGSTCRSKLGTPAHSKFVPKACSTSKIDKTLHGKDSISTNAVLSSKSHSALKASRDEFREREKRKQEKEKEALKKREALLEGLSEQKRKKREEKHLKAQIQREQMEKENLKKLEVQKLRDEKYQQALAEKEEKIQKLRLEAERKRLLAKKKAEEHKEKMKEELRLNETTTIETNDLAKLALLKQQQERDQQQQLPPRPIYMVTRAPLLPTTDCYDSDESGDGKHYRKIESWAKDNKLNKMLYAALYAGETVKNTFFSRQTHTPDLIQIFEYIDPRKLKRTSSAIWRKPPRYTLFAETSKVHFSEDEDEES